MANANGPRGTSGRGRFKRLSLFALICVLVFASAFTLSRLVAPYLVSSTLVRSAIASAVATWTGHEVLIEGQPEIRFWPDARVTLNDVTIQKRVGGQQELLAKIESLSASFGVWSAFRGAPQFEDFRFVRPHIRVERNLDGHLDWTNEGLLSAAVRSAVADGDTGQRLDATLDASIGNVSVFEGNVTLVDRRTGTTVTVSDLNAAVEWPRLGRELKSRGTFSYVGRSMTFDFQSRQPLLMFAGQATPLTVDLNSDWLSVAFTGMADIVHLKPGEGRVTIDAKSVDALRELSGMRIAGTDQWRTLSLSAEIMPIDDLIRLNNLAFTINGIAGTGLMDLRRAAGTKPQLTGTIAVDQIDLSDLVGAFNLERDRQDAVRAPGISHWVDLDVTLSAQRGSVGALGLGEVATSIMTSANTTKLLIADAALYGGRVNASFSSAGDHHEKGASFRVSLESIDFRQLTSMLDLGGPLPTGTGSVELLGVVEGPFFTAGLENITGSLNLTARDGQLIGFDMAGISRLSEEKAYFQLDAAGSGDYEFDQLEFVARFSEGVAEIEKAVVRTDSETLTLTGIIPFSSRGLAVTGSVAPLSTNGTKPDPRAPFRFFLGGSWPNPVVTPMIADR